MILLGIILYVYMYEPMQSRIDTVRAQSKNPRSQSIEELEQTIAALRQELSAQRTSSCHDDQLHAVLGYVDSANLALEHCAVQDTTIVLQAGGTFKQIQHLFDQLATSAQRLIPRNVRITRGVDNHFTLSVNIET